MYYLQEQRKVMNGVVVASLPVDIAYRAIAPVKPQFQLNEVMESMAVLPISKLRTVRCKSPKEYNEFTPSMDVALVRVKGGAVFQGGLCWFPTEQGSFADDPLHANVDGDGFYRTVFGPCVSNSGVTYCACDSCFQLGSMRLLGAVENDLSLQALLRANQNQFILSHSVAIERLRSDIAPFLAGWKGVYEEAKEHHSDPHQKLALRLQAWADVTTSGEVYDDLWFNCRETGKKVLIYKMKKGEIAKNGKKPRGIGDLGVAASLQGFVYTGLIKEAFSKLDYVHNGVRYEFLPSPNRAALKAVFQKLMHPPERGYFVCFSDDACFSLRIGDVVYMSNLDIKSCDRSHSTKLFELFRDIGDVEIGQVLIDQCRSNFRIHRYKNGKLDSRCYVELKPLKNVLFSGSTITTAINNLANFLNFVALAEANFSEVTDVASFASVIERECRLAGYLMEVVPCVRYEHLQLLKHSPHLTTSGEYEPLINLGVFFRTFGRCVGDLPGKGDLDSRARFFNACLLQGMYPYLRNPFIDSLKKRFGSYKQNLSERTEKLIVGSVSNTLAYKVDGSVLVKEFIEISNHDLCQRYDTLPSLEADLTEFAHVAAIGVHYSTPAFDGVLEKDYGMVGVSVSC
jgi:hypothetical protein